ncbi:MAG: non-homologous end-joining DNA ligase [Verrucomicrobiota bacterium]
MKKNLFDDTGLKAYRAKRDFQKTKEPKPHVGKNRSQKQLLFVIQKHDASRLHYDFRLEMKGVLKSWAVPKGIPMQRGEKHLAIHVEDHPMDYAHFEGTIPQGNYGGGTVMVWDSGTYEVMDMDPIAALKKGKMHLQMAGKKLKGEWALIRLKPRAGEKESWLLFKGGEDAKSISKKKDDESVLTGRSMEKIAGENDAQWNSSRKSGSSKKTARLPKNLNETEDEDLNPWPSQKKTSEKIFNDAPLGKIRFVEPMKCRPMKEPPRGKDWIYEIKFDGFRTLALKEKGVVQLLSRSAKDLTARFPEIAEAMEKLPFKNGVLDGEVVALDEKGRSSFQLLQTSNMPGEPHAPLCFYAFDVLNLDGKNLTGHPLARRKQILQNLLPLQPDVIRFSANIQGDPQQLLQEVRKRGLEGIIAKRADSEYEPGLRSGAWAKIKVINEQEFVIGGYTLPKGSRDFFGAILVGYYKNGQLTFASKVGTGFNQALLKSLHKEFQKIPQDKCPFVNLPEKRTSRYGQGVTAAEMKRCTWVNPSLVCQIHFTEWTRDGHLRHPVFLGLRDDKNAKDVKRENIL